MSTLRLGQVLERVDNRGRPNNRLLGVSLAEGVRERSSGDGRPAPSQDLSGYKFVAVGDIVMNALGKPHGSIGRAAVEGITSPAYWVLRCRPTLDSHFAHHLLRSTWSVQRFAGLGKNLPPNQFDISWETFSSIEAWVPSVQEQRRIADFLDDRAARIDQIVEARNDQVLALADWEQSRLTEALVHRDDDVVPLRRLGVTVTTGPFGTVFAASEYTVGGVPMINPTHIQDGRLQPDENHSVSHGTAARLQRHQLGTDDLIVSRKGDIGRTARVLPEQAGWICGSDSIALHTMGSSVDASLLDLLLKLDSTRDQLFAESNAATMPSLNEGNLLALRVPNLSPQVQVARARMGQSIRVTIGRAILDLRQSIDLLNKYKQSLITAAVTGELDVTTAGSGIPR